MGGEQGDCFDTTCRFATSTKREFSGLQNPTSGPICLCEASANTERKNFRFLSVLPNSGVWEGILLGRHWERH
jgi:hypothetical protein